MVPGRGGIPYNGLYGDAPPERGTLLGSRYGKGVPLSGWGGPHAGEASPYDNDQNTPSPDLVRQWF